MQNQFCTFMIGGQLFGLPVQTVDEVIAGQSPTEVPLAPKTVAGLLNRRGQIVSAIDLRTRLDLGERVEKRTPLNVIVRCSDQRCVSLLVDSIGDIIAMDDRLREPIPNSLPASMKEVTDCVYKLPDQLMVVLNADKTVKIDNTSEPSP